MMVTRRITYCVHTNANLLKAAMLTTPPIMAASLNGMKISKMLMITPRTNIFVMAKKMCGPRPLHGDQTPASRRRWPRVPLMLDVMKTLSPGVALSASVSSLTGR